MQQLQRLQLKMADMDILKMISYSTGGVMSKVLMKEGAANVTLFCMAKGTDISDHATPKSGFLYVLEGKGRFVLEGKVIDMRKGIMIQLSPNAKHSLSAEEDTSFLLTLC
jgi:quercetin dioxygenase-like cupin family protein